MEEQSNEKVLNEAEQALVDSFDQDVVATAKKLNMNYWNFGSTEELKAGIDRFLAANPEERKLLEQEEQTNE